MARLCDFSLVIQHIAYNDGVVREVYARAEGNGVNWVRVDG